MHSQLTTVPDELEGVLLSEQDPSSGRAGEFPLVPGVIRYVQILGTICGELGVLEKANYRANPLNVSGSCYVLTSIISSRI